MGIIEDQTELGKQLPGMSQELCKLEEQLRDLKWHMRDEIMKNLKDAERLGLVSINWQAIKRWGGRRG